MLPNRHVYHLLLALCTVASSGAVLGASDAELNSATRTVSGSQWTIVETFAVPEGASGLAFDGTYLYCGIYGVNGSEVYQIDPQTGDYVLLFTGPQEDAYGLTYDGQYLWTTDHAGGASDPAIAMQLDWDGTLLDQITLPTHYISGIAYDGGNFWVSRYYPDPGHMYQVDSTGTILDEFDGPDNQPWDLCIENGNLWMADYWGDTLYKLDAATGVLLDSHPSEGVDPAGIVWDGQYLWYCDNGEGGVDFLYKVDLAGSGTPAIEVPVNSHDFGSISIGETDAWNVTVNNTGSAALTIDDVTFNPPGDLACTADFPVIIGPGGNTTLPIEFSPTAFGALDAVATIASNDPVHPDEALTLSGYGVYPDPTIALDQDMHDYGEVRLNAHTRWFLELSNQGNQVLTVTDIAIDDPHFYVDSGVELPIVLNTLESIQIGLWFSPDSADLFAGNVSITSDDPVQNPAVVQLIGDGVDMEYPMGQSLWSYTINTDFDNSPKAIAYIPDVSGDGRADVIVCSEDDYVRCFNGNAHGTGDVLWEHEIFAGSVYSQNGLQIVPDIDDDTYSDVIVGAAWGGRLIRAISGRTGNEIWTYDTHEYGDGGWVYQVNCRYDYNNDDVVDVLASTGDDSSDTGPKRVYCLNGLSGVKIWERPLAGPVFGVIGVEDFTNDGQPDVVAGASNESETVGRVFGINGADGLVEWTFVANGSSVWALEQIDDITEDGIKDIIAGDFSAGTIYGLNATTGEDIPAYFNSGFGLLTRFQRVDDVNGDGHPDIIPAHSNDFARMINGLSGATVWTRPVADNASTVARIADVSGDGVNDIVLGTLFTSNFAYFLDGTDGSILDSFNYGTPVDAIGAIPDVVGDNSWEMIVGGRNGLVTCISGGTAVMFDPADINQDGQVDVVDLLALIAAWGPCPGCPEDVNGDGEVNVEDLLILLAHWST